MDSFWLINSIIFIGLVFASITDMKTREVPDYLNYSMTILGLVLAIITSLLVKSFWPLINSLVGFGVGFGVGSLMYYTAQWGGGDAKMLMAMGTLIGINVKSFIVNYQMPFFITLILTIFFAGAFYGVIYSIFIMIKNWSKFVKKWNEVVKERKMIILQIGVVLIVFIIFGCSNLFVESYVLKMTLSLMSFMMLIVFYLSFVIKVIEKSCMVKNVDVCKLTEGDWIVKDVKIKNKVVCSPKDLGISKEQIDILKKNNIRKVWIKEGIPFIPSFLIGFIIMLIWGNWFLILF